MPYHSKPTVYASMNECGGKNGGRRQEVTEPEMLDPAEEAERFLGIEKKKKKKVKGLVLEQDTW